MAFETLRSNKMRSALTVLGVVIGVTSIVGMTSLIRGFDSSLRDSINALGPNTIIVQRFGARQLVVGRVVQDADAAAEPDRGRRAGDRDASAPPSASSTSGSAPARRSRPTERIFYRGERTRPVAVMGTTEKYVEVNFAKMFAGRSFTEQEVAAQPAGRGDRLRRLRGAVRKPRHRSRSASRSASAPSSTRCSAWSTSGRRLGGFGRARTTSRSCPTRRLSQAVRQRARPARAVRRHAGDDRGRCPREGVDAR